MRWFQKEISFLIQADNAIWTSRRNVHQDVCYNWRNRSLWHCNALHWWLKKGMTTFTDALCQIHFAVWRKICSKNWPKLKLEKKVKIAKYFKFCFDQLFKPGLVWCSKICKVFCSENKKEIRTKWKSVILVCKV